MATWQINEIRNNPGNKACIIFIHGFIGDPVKTWALFAGQLSRVPSINGWNMLSFGYESSFIPDLTDLWQGKPPVKTIADSLRTFMRGEEAVSYNVLLFIAHSMGGLVIQRALLDDDELANKTDKVILFGTPSFGLNKAWIFQHPLLWRFFRQLGDMGKSSVFITTLRDDWNKQFGTDIPFGFLAVAGRNDEFVPISASIEGFPDAQCAVVPGNHLTIIRPDETNDASVQLVLDFIQGKEGFRGALGTAELALEKKKFEQVVEQLGPNSSRLDSHALVDLALALDGLGRRTEAIQVLTRAYQDNTDTDAMGVLAGRHKRNWLQDRIDLEARAALDLYSKAYHIALNNGQSARANFQQAFYHGINLAFLALVYENDPVKAENLAREVLEHCECAKQKESLKDSMWRRATEGEACLILGRFDSAIECYRLALQGPPEPEPWQLASTAQQAMLIAEKVGDEELSQSLLKLFSGDQS